MIYIVYISDAYNPSDNADMSNEKGKFPSPKAYGIELK